MIPSIRAPRLPHSVDRRVAALSLALGAAPLESVPGADDVVADQERSLTSTMFS